jgi:hypothetical protein
MIKVSALPKILEKSALRNTGRRASAIASASALEPLPADGVAYLRPYFADASAAPGIPLLIAPSMCSPIAMRAQVLVVLLGLLALSAVAQGGESSAPHVTRHRKRQLLYGAERLFFG